MTKAIITYEERSLFKYVKVLKLTLRSRKDWREGGNLRETRPSATTTATEKPDSIEELHVSSEAHDGNHPHAASDVFLYNFINSLWKTPALSNIKRLHLVSSSSGFKNLIPKEYHFPSLSELSLHILVKPQCTLIWILHPYPYIMKDTLSSGLVPFLNQHSSQLRSLKISSKNYSLNYLDIGHSFEGLNDFPLLEEFHLTDPCSHRYHSLNHLQSFVLRHSGSLTSLAPTLTKHNLETYHILASCLRDQKVLLSNLRKLEVRPEYFLGTGPGLAAAFQSLLNRCRNSLEDLTFTRDYVSIDQVEILVELLESCPRITNLTLRLKHAGDVFDVFDLVSTVSSLRSLHVYLPAHFGRGLDNFRMRYLRANLWTGRYSHVSQMKDIGIYFGTSPAPLYILWMFAPAISSIESFFRRGFMEVPHYEQSF
ncbi:hypothetical protein BDQ17DRAFT_554680 [Cyathus striatus]|nr:hypothetical protein BDQ17DRAFT_554680 [Cyathus striatus]